MQLTLCELTEPANHSVESYSPFCLKTHRALKVAKLPYLRRFGAHPGVHKALNPQQQVPILLEGETPISDSTRILQRIVDLAPGALQTSAEAWLWEELADTTVNGFVVAARWYDQRNWPAVKAAYFPGMPAPVRAVLPALIRSRVLRGLQARDVTRAGAERCWERFEKLISHLNDRAPATGFWLGPDLSVADVSLFGQLQSLRLDLTPWQKSQIERADQLRAWLDRVDAAS